MRRHFSPAFALPTVIIAATILFAVLVSVLSTVASSSASLNAQIYEGLAKDAAESGVRVAKHCLAENDGTVTWSNSSPLRPGSSCNGTTSCTDDTCYILNTPTVRTSFTVTEPTQSDSGGTTVNSINSKATVELKRKSDGTVWKSYTHESRLSDSVSAGVYKNFKSIETGGSYVCAIASDNQVYCWGSNSNGQLGDGSYGTGSNKYIPTPVDTTGVLAGKTIKQLSAGSSHSCVIASDNQAYCWGNNSSGQLGTNDKINSPVPIPVSTSGALSGKTIKQISAGNTQTCVIASDNQAYCWGSGYRGQLGDNTSTDRLTPTQIYMSGALSGKTIKQISAGSFYTCAVASDDQAYCWGDNYSYELGDNTGVDKAAPVAVYTAGVLSGKTIKYIGAGRSSYNTTCVIASDNLAYCWGDNLDGKNGTYSNGHVPAAVIMSGALSGKTVKQISTGYYHNCLVASDDQAYCWGWNDQGQVGDTTAVPRYSPTPVSTSGVLNGKTIKQISASASYSTCALASDNLTYCWGDNSSGQLGYPYTNVQLYPSEVYSEGILSGNTITSILSAGDRSCVIDSNNMLSCWGDNSFGELGDGTYSNSSFPVYPDMSGDLSGKTIKSVGISDAHTCVIASDDQAYCWGWGDHGQLGDGDNGYHDYGNKAVVDISGVLSGKTLESITAGGTAIWTGYTCALDSNGKAYCWGSNDYGQLGDGTNNESSLPVAVDTSGVLSGKTLVSIVAGYNHTCALDSNGKAYCWGDNGRSQLGDGNGGYNSHSYSPVAVDTSDVLSGKTLVSITAGGDHTCALDSNGKAYCWGDNGEGQIGDGSGGGGYYDNAYSPVAVDTSDVLSGKTLVSIVAGDSHTCAIDSNGEAYCWGYNYYGQLGDSTTDNRLSPVAIDTSNILAGKTFKDISLGNNHTCVVSTSGKAYCWGFQNSGQLGNIELWSPKPAISIPLTISRRTIFY